MRALITGGARSGKSGFAERYAGALGTDGIYVATCQVYDQEMRERIDRHRTTRERSGFRWDTVEEPYGLTQLLDKWSGALPESRVVVVDCLTLWLSNWLLRCGPEETNGLPDERLLPELDRLVEAVRRFDGKLLLVTNEVGSGIVPEYPLGRRFRDLAGMLNQRLAAVCDEAYAVLAGVPLDLKRLAFTPGERV